jgi:hypothetical protein
MQRDADISETQQKLADRPIIVTGIVERRLLQEGKGPLWNIENKGLYPIRDLRLRVLYFKKVVALGWQDSISGEATIAELWTRGTSCQSIWAGIFSPIR